MDVAIVISIISPGAEGEKVWWMWEGGVAVGRWLTERWHRIKRERMAKEVLVHDYQKMQQMKGLFGVCVCLQRNVAWEGKQKRERKAAVGRGQQRKMRELRTKEQREWEQIEAAFQRCCMLSPALPLSNPHDLASNGSRGDHFIGWMSPWSQSPCRLFSPPHRTSFNLLSSNSITQSHYVRWLPGE